MSEPFIAEIRIMACNFAPSGWAFCDGQLLPISQNTALFSLIGTTYGGDGETTTALPNLQGRVPMHPGRGPGLTNRRLGERGGETTTTLTLGQMASHAHTLVGSSEANDSTQPVGNYLGELSAIYGSAGNLTPMAEGGLENQGGSQPHNNVQPLLSLNFCIALVGLYPSF